MLQKNFAILLCNEVNDENSIANIVRKISLRRHIPFNRLTINDKKSYILYNVDKIYLFNMGTNKKLKFIYKNAKDFYIIDFFNNKKGNIINYLTFNETTTEKIKVDIEYPNIKKNFQNKKHLPLFYNGLLEENEPLLYKHFCIYIKS